MIYTDFREGAEKLRELVTNRRLIIFAGSGVSVASSLPSWDGLLEWLVEFCQESNLAVPEQHRIRKEIIDAAKATLSSEPVKVATVLKHALKNLEIATNGTFQASKNLGNFLSDRLNGSGIRPNENHYAIVGTSYPFILTSNYDRLFEQAAREREFRSLASGYSFEDAAAVARLIYEERSAIIHLHGDIRSVTMDTFVLTSDDYTRVRRDYPGFTLAIQSLFLRYSVLFVGYGLSDPHLEEFLDDLAHYFKWTNSGSDDKKFFILLKRDKANAILSMFKDRLRTDIIPLDDYAETPIFLNLLRDFSPRPQESPLI